MSCIGLSNSNDKMAQNTLQGHVRVNMANVGSIRPVADLHMHRFFEAGLEN